MNIIWRHKKHNLGSWRRLWRVNEYCSAFQLLGGERFEIFEDKDMEKKGNKNYIKLPKPHVARFAIFDDDRAPIQLSDGSVSNGHWALKSKFIPANLQKCLDKYDLLTNNYQIDDLILKQSEPAELSKVFTDETGLITAILEGRNKINSIYLNAHYYSYLIRWGFTVEITDDLIPQVIKKDDQIAGAIMPVSKGNGNDQNR